MEHGYRDVPGSGRFRAKLVPIDNRQLSFAIEGFYIQPVVTQLLERLFAFARHQREIFRAAGARRCGRPPRSLANSENSHIRRPKMAAQRLRCSKGRRESCCAK
jgi:hypothetical protein